MNRLKWLGAVAVTSFALAGIARAESVTIGYLSDLSGASSQYGGESSLVAIKMAIEDAGGKALGEPVKLVSADTQNKPDVGLAIAREWIDRENVNALIDVNNSSLALAVADFIRDKKNVVMLSSAATTKLTNENCVLNHVQMLQDSASLARSLVLPLVDAGNDNWFFITVDYAFGHDAEARAAEAVESAGGKVVGSVRFSPQTTDYSAFLLEAQAKGAETIGVVSFGSYLINTMKQAQEFGMKAKLVPFYMAETEIQSIGLENMHNVSSATSFYWDRNEKTRAFSKRYEEIYGRPANFHNAQQYDAVTLYLKAVEAAGTTNVEKVVEKMREMAFESATDVSGYVREDGRFMRDMYAFDVKTPDESKGEWDLMKITATADKEDINEPLSKSTCPLVRK